MTKIIQIDPNRKHLSFHHRIIVLSQFVVVRGIPLQDREPLPGAEDVESRPKIGRRGQPLHEREPLPGAENEESRPKRARSRRSRDNSGPKMKNVPNEQKYVQCTSLYISVVACGLVWRSGYVSTSHNIILETYGWETPIWFNAFLPQYISTWRNWYMTQIKNGLPHNEKSQWSG